MTKKVHICIREIVEILDYYKKLLKVNENITLFTNRKLFLIINKFRTKYKDPLGETTIETKCIYINVDSHKEKRYFSLMVTIVHELLHIKYPKLSEKKIENMAIRAVLNSGAI